jgi:hypothetical protein
MLKKLKGTRAIVGTFFIGFLIFTLCKIENYLVQHILTPGPRFRIRIILGSWILSWIRI